MSDTRRILWGLTVWIVAITGFHLALNVDWSVLLNERLPEAQRRMNVAYIPVT
jgi:hypothetical protein